MDSAYLKTLVNGIPDVNLQRILKTIVDYMATDIRFGRATGQGSGTATAAGVEPSQNLSGGFFTVKTPHVANTEFRLAHTFGRAPYLLLQVLPLDQVNAGIARMTVSKAADASYIYLKSPDIDTNVFLYLEG